MSKDFGPFSSGFEFVDFGNAESLEKTLEANPNICAYIMEPIQGEAGIIVPPEGYLTKVSEICKKHKVLLVCDEIQAGLGRSGNMLAHKHEAGCDPDIITVSKSLGGGILPFSAIYFKDELKDLLELGSHGQTFMAYPFGAAVATEALKVI